MSLKTKIFISLVIAVGWVELIRNLLAWRADDLTGFLVYFATALVFSGLKLRLPGVSGSISVCFLFILIGIVSLSLPHVLVTGCAAVLVQQLWHATKKARAVQLLFNVGSAAFSISTSYRVFHSVWLHSLPLEQSVLLAVLACTYFVTTTILVAAVVAFTEGKSMRAVWRTSYFWALPYYLVGAATAGLFEIIWRRLGWQTSMLAIPAAYLIYRSYCIYLDRLEDKRRHAEETAALHLRTIESLALAIEAKDHTTHDHLQRVQIYAVEIGKDLGLSEPELQAIRTASVLHDIGKIGVPEHIICKPGKLTPEEFAKMKIHPVIGAEILARAQFPYPVVPIVRSHHEKWDGSGYPDGLKGEEIPIGARILAAVDCLDALASDRQYRRALPIGKAMEMVASQSGKAFDPSVVALLKQRYVELEQVARSTQCERFSLSTNINVERGEAPDAGFEESADPSSRPSTSSADWSALVELIQGLTGILSRQEVLSILAGRLQDILPCDCLAFYSRRDSTLLPEYATGTHVETLTRLKVPMGQGLSGWVAANGRSILNGNPSVDSSSLIGLRSALAIPLEGEEDVAGVLTLFRAKADAFSAMDLLQLSALGDALGDLMESSDARPTTRQNVIAMASQPAPHTRALNRTLQPV